MTGAIVGIEGRILYSKPRPATGSIKFYGPTSGARVREAVTQSQGLAYAQFDGHSRMRCKLNADFQDREDIDDTLDQPFSVSLTISIACSLPLDYA